jgi:uncharacterized protein YndB with AHSA1/START domain
MNAILMDLWINAKPVEIFNAVSTPKGLNSWWTLDADGVPEDGEVYRFHFGPEYDWKGKVTFCSKPYTIQWEMFKSDPDWDKTVVGFEIFAEENGSLVKFFHKGWSEVNDHFRRSNYCWATYLRLLKRYIENGEFVPYEHRPNA